MQGYKLTDAQRKKAEDKLLQIFGIYPSNEKVALEFYLNIDTVSKLRNGNSGASPKSIKQWFHKLGLPEPNIERDCILLPANKKKHTKKEPDENLTLSPNLPNQVNDINPKPLPLGIYVERPPLENKCYEAIQKPGGLVRIKAPQKMGKTRLLNKVLEYATTTLGYKTVKWQFGDPSLLADTETLFKRFCFYVSCELNLPDKTDEYWKKYKGSGGDFIASKFYFEEYLLSTIDTNLVVGLDRFEELFKNQDIFVMFCALLRDFNDFAAPTRDQIWKKLRLVIVNSTEKYPELDINHSPFNVGVGVDESIGLTGFTESQVETLLNYYHLDGKLAKHDLKSLIELVQGHPYLINQALTYLQDEQHTIQELLNTASSESGQVFIRHLRELLQSLEQNQLTEAYKRVIFQQNVILDTKLSFKLHSLGLIKFSGDYAVSSCNLYSQYFYKHLVEAQVQRGILNE